VQELSKISNLIEEFPYIAFVSIFIITGRTLNFQGLSIRTRRKGRVMHDNIYT